MVGFHRGRISRVTKRCEMLGIVSRKAVVEGSAPPQSERHLWDTVAYCGVAPVKLRKALGAVCDTGAFGGQLITPSGRNDGTAVIASAGSDATPRIGILLDASYTEVAEGGVKLVQVVVIAPAETVRGQRFARTGRIRALVQCLLAAMLITTTAIVLLRGASRANLGNEELPTVPAGSGTGFSQPFRSCTLVRCTALHSVNRVGSYVPNDRCKSSNASLIGCDDINYCEEALCTELDSRTSLAAASAFTEVAQGTAGHDACSDSLQGLYAAPLVSGHGLWTWLWT